ncbi:MAG: TetR/AcrR family transcriptional regulator [Oscillospiraceae bacterium]
MKNKTDKRDLQRMSNEEANTITKKSLQSALIYLMAEKSFDSISITELVKRSGVSRMAFYRNYKAKEDILNELVTGVVDKVIDSLKSDEVCSNVENIYRRFYEEIKANSDIVMILYRSDLLNIIIGIVVKLFNEKYESADEKTKYVFSAVLGAHIGITTKWIKNGMPESSEYMAFVAADIQKKLVAGL